MNPSTLLANGSANFQVLLEDGERVFCRVGSHANADGSVLTVLPAAEHPTPATLDRLAHEYGLKEELDGAWAVRPLELIREGGRTMLVLEDPGGEPLERLLGAPLETDHFLRLAIDITGAVGKLHRRGLLHKDVKPSNILVNRADGRARLTGFGIASRVPRERQAPEPPETIAGTLAYMAPEQTGRMNRSIDSRSDLYALGVTFYQMLTGSLPFTAADPMEWVHCHIARKPLPPSERSKRIPVPVSEIIMKLLAKTAEERYQTAAGVESDLRHCLAERERKGRIDRFELGEHDAPDRLLLPEKLYGRAREIEALLASFDRIVNSAVVELVLVSGYSGIGKSSVVNELHRVLVEPRGLFASGKFDQYKRDIPYSTLAQAFQSLIRPLLGRSDPELAGWREAFRAALGPNGRLIIDLVPELKLIVGDQPPVPELPPRDAQRRFQLVFRRFLAVFARPEHPLALFLDDLQWLDSATLDLLEDLLTQPDVQHLMLIGAYRDNEVDSAHPLIRKLEAIRKAGAVVHEIILAPLAREDLGQLIGDALHCEPERVTALAELIHGKTAGNPFFANQLVSVLVEEGLLTFDYGEGRWSWDLNSIRAKGYTDNVVGLMVGKLNRLPVETQHALQLLACMGNSAECALLEMVWQQSNEKMHGQLWEAVRAGLIFRTEQSYTFFHDRIQEAAYSLIPEEARAETHLRIGRLLATRIAPEEREEAIFEIVNQLNRGTPLITSQGEREQLAELNLAAGKRAKASAYASALNYFATGATLLEEGCWERRYELIFALEQHRAQCEFLTGEMPAAEQRLTVLAARAGNTLDRATVASLRVELHLTTGRTSRAVDIGLDYIRGLGIDWSLHPTDEDVRAEYERMRSQLGDRVVEDLIDMPFLSDSTCLVTVEILTRLFSAAARFDANLMALVVCRAVSLSLEFGNCDASCAHYAWLGRVVAGRFGDYQAAYRFGRLACDLVDRRGLTRFQAEVYYVAASNAIPWGQHVRDSRKLMAHAFDAASRTGNLIYEGYCLVSLNANMLVAGDPLAETQKAIEASFHQARKMKFGYVTDLITMQLDYVRTLRGHSRTFASFDDQHPEEDAAEHAFTGNPDLAVLETLYWIRVLQARFLAGDHVAANNARSRAERLLWTVSTEVAAAEFHFYGALSLAACCHSVAASETRHLDLIHAHHTRLRAWERNCPANFEHRSALVGAEIARIEGREAEAMRLYEQAIRAAEANGFVHHKAIACELAGYFYGARGFEKIAHLYLRDARLCYLHWGADAKVRQLEQRYPHLAGQEPAAGPTSTIGAPVEHLDLATVIKVSQAVSSEIVLENLIDTLMHTAMEQAGAERALLIVLRGQEPCVEAEATTSGDTVTVRLVDEVVTERVLPESVLHYVLRTREIVILDDAAAHSPFGVDSYIHQRQARSILCLPLLNQAKLIGVLYLENNLTPRVFAPARISVLKLLASQAAIALENARLYRNVAEREKQQAATSEMLRLISNSPIHSVLDAVAENAARLCDANNTEIFRLEDNLLRLVASFGEIPVVIHAYQGVAVNRDTVTGRAACDRRTIHVHDLAAEEGEYPVGSSNAKREGHRTTLATPLLRGGTAVGIILVRRMELRPFSDQQIALIETFADQAAIAVENARLFESEKQRGLALARANRDLAEREAKIRRLVDANIIGIFIWDFDGRILEANEAFLDIVGYDHDDLVVGSIRWKELTPPEWQDRDARLIEEQKVTGTLQPFEKEYFRKDGSRVPVLIGVATFQEGENQGVAFVLDLTERKRAEQALRRSEAYLAEAQRLGHSGVAAYNDTAILYGSEEIFRIWGFDPAQGVPSREAVFQRVHPGDRGRLNAEVQRAVREKTGYSIGYRLVLPDGTVKHLEAVGQPVFSASGELVEIVTTQIDVTERKRGEQALREREAQLAEARRELRQMIDTIPIPLASYSADARRDFVNAAWKQYTGLSDEAALGTEWSAVAHPDHIASGEKMWRDAFATGEPWHTEERVRRADGQYRWFAIDRVAARDENGKIIKWYGTAYDIEDRRRAEERLLVQHTVAQILSEAATIEEAAPRILRAMGERLGWDLGALWRVDREAEVLRCVELWHKASIEVPEFERVSREFTFAPGSGLPGRVWSSLEPEYVPDVVPDENFPRGPIAEREGLHSAFGFPILLGGEVLGVIEIFSREIRQPDQELLSMLATIGSQIGQFIERKRAEESFRKVQMQLAHANRVATMGQLSASIAHEVNQPITAAITYALAARRWLSAEPPNFHEVDDALSLIVKEGNRAGEVVARIRALIEKAPARKDAVVINDAILEVIALTRTEAASNGVSVRTQLREGLPPIQGDRVQLQQVVLNLIINAIEAMRDVGEQERELLISTRNQPDGVSVEVRDSGPGFAPAALERVFEAFYTTKSDGLGLGLSICRSIIEAHDGRLWASPNVPRGAILGFIAPAHPDAAS